MRKKIIPLVILRATCLVMELLEKKHGLVKAAKSRPNMMDRVDVLSVHLVRAAYGALLVDVAS